MKSYPAYIQCSVSRDSEREVVLTLQIQVSLTLLPAERCSNHPSGFSDCSLPFDSQHPKQICEMPQLTINTIGGLDLAIL